MWNMQRYRGATVGALLTAAALCSTPPAVRAQMVDTTLWCFSPGDRVLAIGRLNHTLYLGGSFLYVGPSTGAGVPMDLHTAKPLPHYARVVGVVQTTVADGNGGWFVGGLFTSVGGFPRRNLAHIEADGSVSSWDPRPNNQVLTMALAGSTLYVGGDFDSVGAETRRRVAALSTSSDAPLPFRCDADARVTTVLAAGSIVYVGGWFGSIEGQARSYVAAVDAASGVPRPWQVSLDDRVSALALHDTTLLIGGYFSAANTQTHRCLLAIGAQTAAVHPWNVMVDRQPPSTLDFGPHVSSILCTGDSIFIGGSFTHIGGQSRRSLAQVNALTAEVTGWNPHTSRQTILGPEVFSMALSGDTLLVAAACDSIGGDSTGQVSALSARTAQRFPWDPVTNDAVFAIAIQHNVVYVGGRFTSVGEWVLRRGLAAIDEVTGHVTTWDPQANNGIQALLVYGGLVYVGGNFDVVGGLPRESLAALDPVTGRPTPWNPGSNGFITALAPRGSSVLVGGALMSQVGGSFRRGIAAVDTSTGLATGWDARADGDVFAIAATDSAIYIGGDFSTMGGQPRESLAALDPTTGDATPWNPGADAAINAITVCDSTIYVGGFFGRVAGQPRSRLAAIDRVGAVTSWAPDADFPVQTLASDDSTIYAGGFFSTVFGESHEWFAALDPRRPIVRKAFPQPDGPVWALKEDAGTVYVGGGFGKMGPWPQVCFAAIRPRTTSPPTISSTLVLSPCSPNPASTSAVIRYSLPADLPVTVTLFDLQGRRAANVVSDPIQRAGPHQVTIPTTALRAGCYLYELRAGTLRAAHKMIVVK
jgi:hypothetical protein